MSIELSKWRLEKAERTFREGEGLQKIGSYNGAINRYYYAAFHAVRALLASEGLDSAKHSGVIAMFNREFVKSGIISKKASKTLADLFTKRSEADYDDFRTFSDDDVIGSSKAVRNLIDEIKLVLENKQFRLDDSSI